MLVAPWADAVLGCAGGLSRRGCEHAVEQWLQCHDRGADYGGVDLDQGPVDGLHAGVAIVEATLNGREKNEAYYGNNTDAVDSLLVKRRKTRKAAGVE